MMEINHLPSEMLLEVHRRLTPSNLKKAVLVDKLWRDVGQDPSLWKWCKVAVYTKEDIDNLSIKRLQQIKEILINPTKWDAHDWEAFFRAAEEFSNLKKIDGLGRGPNGLNLVEPGLFARTLAKLEDVTVRRCTYDHVEALLKEMSSTTQVKRFRLWADDLTQMESGLFARVLSRLEVLQLGVSRVTKDQTQALFTEILNNRSLKRLDLLDGNIWRYLEPGFFARVLSTVEYVSLADYDDPGIDSSQHLEALFAELSVGTQLKILRLNDTYLPENEPAQFANALAGLEELRLERTSVSTDQIQDLFTEMSLRTQMKKLVLVGTDLWQLDPELFARVIVRLEDVNLNGSHNTTDQMMELFIEMSSNNHLKSLNLNSVNLSHVDPEVLAKAVAQLEALTLSDTYMTSDQAVSLFSEMSQNTVMKKIDLHWIYSDLSSVEPEVLASALVRLEDVRVGVTVDVRVGVTVGQRKIAATQRNKHYSFSHDQAKALFREMSRNSHLKKLDLSCGDFTSVDPEVLAAAVTNVEEVDLRGCNLSADQITSIFARVLEGEKKLRKLKLGGAVADVNPEIVRKVEEKLKGQLA